MSHPLEVAVLEGELDAYAPLGDLLMSLDRDEEAEQRLREGLNRGARGAAAVLAHLLEINGRTEEAAALQRRIERDARDMWLP